MLIQHTSCGHEAGGSLQCEHCGDPITLSDLQVTARTWGRRTRREADVAHAASARCVERQSALAELAPYKYGLSHVDQPATRRRAPRRVPGGAISYRECGTGTPIVFVHGVAVNGDLWRRVVPRLAGGYRCITPDLPWGSHSAALKPDTDLSLPGMARIIADFLDALDLDNVAVVANDTGGAVAQALVGSHPDRIARLVLTSCDAFEKFPPTPQKYLRGDGALADARRGSLPTPRNSS